MSMRRPINDVAVIVSCISLVWSIWVLVMMNIAESRFGSMPGDEFMTVLKHFGTVGLFLFLCAVAVLWLGAARFLLAHWAELGGWAKVIWVYCMLFGPTITPFVCWFLYRRPDSRPRRRTT
jgi:hypothetical protein